MKTVLTCLLSLSILSACVTNKRNEPPKFGKVTKFQVETWYVYGETKETFKLQLDNKEWVKVTEQEFYQYRVNSHYCEQIKIK